MHRSSFAQIIRPIRGLMLRHMPLMITCREFEDFLLAYLADELPNRQRFVFDLHIKICRDCRAYLAAYRNTVEIAERAFDDRDQPVPKEVPDDLVKAILAAKDE